VRYFVGFVLAGLVALPLSASAQTGQEGAMPEEPVSSPAPGTEVPELRAPTPDIETLSQRAIEHYEIQRAQPRSKKRKGRQGGTYTTYTLEEMELRVKRARIGVGVSVVAIVGGGFLFLYGLAGEGVQTGATAAFGTGFAVYLGGIGGTIASSILLHRRKRDRDSLRQGYFGTPRRSRLVL